MERIGKSIDEEYLAESFLGFIEGKLWMVCCRADALCHACLLDVKRN